MYQVKSPNDYKPQWEKNKYTVCAYQFTVCDGV